MRKHLFADESGCLAFSSNRGASQYFILCTVLIEPQSIGPELLSLRRQLAWDGHNADDCLHATTDPQIVRDAVFDLICKKEFRVDCTLFEKAKAQPHIKQKEETFYQHAWFYHFKHIADKVFANDDEAFICAASLGTNKKKSAFRTAINNVVQQTIPNTIWRTSFWPAHSDPCLLVADYCAWAVQRKWERNDVRSYDLIRDKIASEFDIWKSGKTKYY